MSLKKTYFRREPFLIQLLEPKDIRKGGMKKVRSRPILCLLSIAGPLPFDFGKSSIRAVTGAKPPPPPALSLPPSPSPSRCQIPPDLFPDIVVEFARFEGCEGGSQGSKIECDESSNLVTILKDCWHDQKKRDACPQGRFAFAAEKKGAGSVCLPAPSIDPETGKSGGREDVDPELYEWLTPPPHAGVEPVKSRLPLVFIIDSAGALHCEGFNVQVGDYNHETWTGCEPRDVEWHIYSDAYVACGQWASLRTLSAWEKSSKQYVALAATEESAAAGRICTLADPKAPLKVNIKFKGSALVSSQPVGAEGDKSPEASAKSSLATPRSGLVHGLLPAVTALRMVLFVIGQ